MLHETAARGLRGLDLFAGAGGATRGLQRAGFDVTAVDIRPEPRNPADRFIQADVLSLTAGFLREFDFVWASPPCQFGTALRHLHNARPQDHSNLIPQTRELLKASGRPYVIENVAAVREHLIEPYTLCGTPFGLGAAGRELQRHRLFETNFPIETPVCRHSGRPVLGVYGGHARDRRRPLGVNHVPESDLPISVGREAMGIDWMTATELSQAIPPIYAEFIARQWVVSTLRRIV
jgi:DNA (cytosine-5)-methyltransferase 1